jgi:hypothetical protein
MQMIGIYTENFINSTLDSVQNSELSEGDKACIAFLFGYLQGTDEKIQKMQEELDKLRKRDTPIPAIPKACINAVVCPHCKATLQRTPDFCGKCGQKLSYNQAQ